MTIIPTSLVSGIVENAHSTAQIKDFISQIAEEIGGVSWRHVGHTDSDPDVNNAGTCEVANDKRAPIAELLFNGIDSVIEFAHMIAPFQAASPHEAVRACPLLSDDTWTRDRVTMSLHDSGVEVRPTVDIRDLGHGQIADNFHRTFLNLHSGSKRSVPYLCGKFGMGMKSSFNHCERTLIVSRPCRELAGNNNDHVGVTVVRRRYSEGDSVVHYEYLCDRDGQIIRARLPDSVFPHGTLVRLVGYDLKGFVGNIGTLNNSIYRLLNSYIVDPPIALTVKDCREKPEGKSRKGRSRGESKTTMRFKGLKHSLERPKMPNSHEHGFAVNISVDELVSNLNVDRDEDAVALGPIPDGKVQVDYFVLHSNESPHDKSGTKIKDDHAITFVHNGQRHGAEPRSIFGRGTALGLGAIRHRIAVVVDTSGLHPVACSNLYSSNRISVNQSSAVYKTIMKSLGMHFAGDARLQALDAEASEVRAVNASANTENLEETMKAFLADVLGSKKPGRRKGGPGVSKGGGKSSHRSADDSHLPDVPTRIVIDNQPLVAPRGRFCNLTLDIDAKNGYVMPGDGKIAVNFPAGVATARSQGRLAGGRLMITVDVPATSTKGESDFDVTLTDPSNGVSLSARGKISVVEPRKGKSGRGNKNSEGDGAEAVEGPNIFVNWIYKGEWANAQGTHPWGPNFPGSCEVRAPNGQVKSVTFLLNGDFHAIERLRTTMGAKNPRLFDRKLHEYGEHLCKALFRIRHHEIPPDVSLSEALAECVFGTIKLSELEEEVDDVETLETAKRGILANPGSVADPAAKA